MLRTAKACIVENEYNRHITLPFCSQVAIITGPIDTHYYFPVEQRQAGVVVVGWIGSPATQKYLLHIADALKKIAETNSVVFALSGVQEDFEIPGVPIRTEKWSLANEVPFVQNLDIGIMPLPDNAWTRGKGGYKLLQYMACGIPVIASPVEVNREIVQDGVNGFLADTTEEWHEKITQLISDAALRKTMGEAGRAMAVNKFSLEKASEIVLALCTSVMSTTK
jgi:glycosyltransferase involved in cell wall biosynthesis